MLLVVSSFELEVWSDIACPWCYVGKRRLEGALKRFPHAAEVRLVWRAFELDPGAPKERERTLSHAERIARKYGMSVAQAQKSTEQLVEVARAEGLSFDFVNIRSGNTFDAHRLLHLGLERGVQDAVKERLLKAYFEQAELMSDHGTLVRLGTEAGLDAREATDVLAGDAYAAAVRADEEQARELGISGVPCFVFNRRLAVSGAQSSDVMLGALQQAWSERAGAPALAEGAACGPDGC
jgi:predicted DsbA family dithiol-disulfide isomerase